MKLPESPKFKALTIKSHTPTLISETHSGKRQVRQRGGHRWLVEAEYPPMSRLEFAPLWAFIVARKGQYETFTFVPGSYGNSSTGTNTAVTALTGQSAGAYSIGTSSQSLTAGDFIKFSGHNKCYMVTSVPNSTSVHIEPPLHADIDSGESIICESVEFTVALVSDQQDTSIDVHSFHSFQLSLVEVIN
jgi:hypothetical protein